ncbi:MAG TPA: M48 family metalloprotease, partial [Burkholderiales bacterium]|nr:M48 family metalloprotease [Burkholderiales bacterium]
MDFFEQQQSARRQTWLMVLVFLIAVAGIVLAINVVGGWIYLYATDRPLLPVVRALAAVPRSAYVVTTLVVLGVVAWGTLTRMYELSGGGASLALMVGARRVKRDSQSAPDRRLLNVVEEMAIASGITVPQAYVMDGEPAINAFAAGYSPNEAAVIVTQGTLEHLSRDELQGVVAHEFSHILNGDTRLNMRLMGLAHGLFWPTIVGRILLRGSAEAPAMGESILDENVPDLNRPLLPLALFFLLLGSIGSPLVRLMKSLICREREWLADAEAVQFTRNPAGIEGALKKIGGLLKQGRLDTPRAEIASHLYFANSAHEPWFRFQSMHPPLAKRILAIDPAFDGAFPRIHSLPSKDAAFDRVYERSLERARAEAEAEEEGSGTGLGALSSTRRERAKANTLQRTSASRLRIDAR